VTDAHAHGALVVAAADILSLTLLTPPGEFGADVCVGSSQRFGVPMGFVDRMPPSCLPATSSNGIYLVVWSECPKIPPEERVTLALQTREQHIRRDKATSNICTAQVLLAVIASTLRRVPRP